MKNYSSVTTTIPNASYHVNRENYILFNMLGMHICVPILSVYVNIHPYMYKNAYICVSIYINVLHTYMIVNICMYVCISVHMCVYMCVCVYVCMYTKPATNKHWSDISFFQQYL